MEWNDEQRAQFLVTAYQQMIETQRAIRARIHLNVQLTLTFYVAAIAFLLAHPEVSPTVRALSTAGFFVLAIVVIGVIKAQAKTVHDVQQITANLEVGMGFHRAGAYPNVAADENLYPPAYSAQNLRGGMFSNRLTPAYERLIYGLALFGIVVALVAK